MVIKLTFLNASEPIESYSESNFWTSKHLKCDRKSRHEDICSDLSEPWNQKENKFSLIDQEHIHEQSQTQYSRGLRLHLDLMYTNIARSCHGKAWSICFNSFNNESRHDKINKVTVRPAKTQISLGIHPVWSEPSLSAQWVAKDPNFLHADSEDSDQTGRMPRLIWVFAGRTVTLLVLSWGGSNVPAAEIPPTPSIIAFLSSVCHFQLPKSF